jgi:plasmid stabilization system protein ParE
MKLTILPRARAEVDEASVWYEERSRGLGSDFLSALDAVLDQILLHPRRWPAVHADVRCLRMRRFPYRIYYRVLESTIEVTRCRHLARRPL